VTVVDIYSTDQSRLAVVIPALNEAHSIESVVRQLAEHALVIVVDDGSTDETAALARFAGAIVVSHNVNGGYDAALETGLLYAKKHGCSYAVTMDADGQHDPQLLELYSKALKRGASLVVGHRDKLQRWSEVIFSVLGRAIWGLHDPLCGMKGYRLDVLDEKMDWNTYNSVGTEITLKLINSGISATEIKIKTKKRNGKSRFGGGFKANFRICKSLIIGVTKFGSRC
jgi:glycosyltransferase involved in cell wall biosynthesis